MTTRDQQGSSLDLVVRWREAILFGSGQVVEGAGLTLTGSLRANEAPTLVLPVELTFDADELASVATSEPEGAQVRFYDRTSNEEYPYRISEYSLTRALGDRYEIHAGVFQHQDGRQADFFALTDPLPLIVIAGAVLGGFCALGSGVAFLVEFIQQNTSGWANGCRATGGYPFVKVVMRPHLRLLQADIGCDIGANGECRLLDGSVIDRYVAQPVPRR